MTERPFYHHADDLPQIIPIFPLPGALLLPRGQLPLNIFEPRYLTMVDDALAGARLIGMVQPSPEPGDPAVPSLYPVGCAGRLTAFRETGDGRYLITLTGICRFRIERELDCLTPYRQICTDYTPFQNDLTPEARAQPHSKNADRSHLLSVLKIYLSLRNLETDWNAIEHAPYETLVNSLAMICPFDPQEKQALLEAPTLAERADILTALIEMANVPNSGNDENSVQ